MRFMVIVKATEESEAGGPPSPEMLEAMTEYNERLFEAGIMKSADGLHPSSRGVRVTFSGDQRTVTDGPFTETKELVAGFWIWELGSLEETIEWVKQCPDPHPDSSESIIEIRQIFEAEDFGENLTPEVREREERMRSRLAGG
jgi:hypothetical protein